MAPTPRRRTPGKQTTSIFSSQAPSIRIPTFNSPVKRARTPVASTHDGEPTREQARQARLRGPVGQSWNNLNTLLARGPTKLPSFNAVPDSTRTTRARSATPGKKGAKTPQKTPRVASAKKSAKKSSFMKTKTPVVAQPRRSVVRSSAKRAKLTTATPTTAKSNSRAKGKVKKSILSSSPPSPVSVEEVSIPEDEPEPEREPIAEEDDEAEAVPNASTSKAILKPPVKRRSVAVEPTTTTARTAATKKRPARGDVEERPSKKKPAVPRPAPVFKKPPPRRHRPLSPSSETRSESSVSEQEDNDDDVARRNSIDVDSDLVNSASSSSSDDGRGGRKSQSKKSVKIRTHRLASNKGKLNALDVVFAGARTKFVEKIENFGRSTPLAKLLNRLVPAIQANYLTRSDALSTLSSTSSTLNTSRAKAKKLRSKLLEISKQRLSIAAAMRSEEKKWKQSRERGNSMRGLHEFQQRLLEAKEGWQGTETAAGGEMELTLEQRLRRLVQVVGGEGLAERLQKVNQELSKL